MVLCAQLRMNGLANQLGVDVREVVRELKRQLKEAIAAQGGSASPSHKP